MHLGTPLPSAPVGGICVGLDKPLSLRNENSPKLCLAQREVLLTRDGPEQSTSGLTIPQTLHPYVILQPSKELYMTGAHPDVELGCGLGMDTTD